MNDNGNGNNKARQFRLRRYLGQTFMLAGAEVKITGINGVCIEFEFILPSGIYVDAPLDLIERKRDFENAVDDKHWLRSQRRTPKEQRTS